MSTNYGKGTTKPTTAVKSTALTKDEKPAT